MFEFGILSKVLGRRRLPVACIALSVIVAAVAISSTAPAEGIQAGVVSTFDVLGTTEAALVLTEEVVGPDGFDKNTMVPVVTDERHASTSASQVPVHPSDRPFDDSIETDEGYIGAPARVRSVYAGSSETFPPSVSVAWPSPFLSVNVGHNQDFSVNASDQDGNISQVEWYLNDTSRWIESLSTTGSIAKTYTHTFAETGDYLVKVVFTDVDGLTGSASWRIRVVNENVATSDYSLVSGPASQFDLDDVFEGRNTNFSAIWKSGNTADDSLPQLELTIQDVDGVILQGYLLVAAPRTAWIDYQNIDVQVQDGSGFDAGTWEQYVPPQDPNSQIVASVNYLLGSFFSIANFLYDDGTGRVTRPTSTLFSGNELNCYQHVAVAWDLGPGGAHEKDGVRVNIPLAAVSAGDRLAVFAHLSVDNNVLKNASTGGIDFPNLFSSEEPFPSCNPPSLSRPRSPESAPLGNPTGLTAEPGSGSGEVVLRWTPATNATMHWVYLEKVDGTDGRYWPDPLDGDAATVTITGLEVGPNYRFLVIAGQEQSDGTPLWSQWSNWARGTPTSGTVLTEAQMSFSSGSYHTCGLRSDGTSVCWGDNSHDQASPPAGETFTAISSGYRHTCGLRSDGTAICWGDDSHGQASPPAGETFAAISSGTWHTCALRTDGRAICWGSSRSPAETFATISSGAYHTCGLRMDDSVVCWGDNSHGQASPPAGETFAAISSGTFHTCGLGSDGSVACWGSNRHGQAMPSTGETFAAISSGSEYTCALRTDGLVACWGRNDDGPGQATPPSGETFAAISSGGLHACGLRASGSVACWGQNARGQATAPAGVNFGVNQFNTLVGSMLVDETEIAISSDGSHTCGLKVDGSAVCWGRNSHGQATPPVGETFATISSGGWHTCGLRADGSGVVICWGGRNEDRPVMPPAGETFATVSSGSHHTCGLRVDGSAVCWGWNRGGQASPPNGEVFTAISSGGFHTCGLRADGSPVCWGHFSGGETMPPMGETFVTISSGSHHVCGLRVDGSAVCWGRNVNGETTLPTGNTFAAISGGAYHTCGLRANGSAVCWGYNEYGQATPPVGETFAAISSGYFHTCGLRANGSVVCWGHNDYGQATPAAGVTFAVNQ